MRRSMYGLMLVAACSDGTAPAGLNPGFFQMVSGDAQTVAAGQQFPQPLVVRVLGTDTMPLNRSRVAFRVAAGSARIDSQSVLTDAAGIARAYVTPLAAGNVQLSASVFSSNFAATFLLAASGTPAAPTCQPATARRLALAQVDPDLGGSAICVGAGDSIATYALVAFNSPAAIGASSDIAIAVAAAGTGPAPTTLNSVSHRFESLPTRNIQSSLAPLIPRAQSWWTTRAQSSASALADTLGNLRQLNVNLADACVNPALRAARVVAISSKAIVVVDTASASALTNADYNSIAQFVDTLVDPAITSNMQTPADIDGNSRVIVFLTGAVNQEPTTFGPPTAAFRTRDLFPTSGGTPLTPICAASNASELFYLAVPDAQGTLGPARQKPELLASMPRALAHEYQHLINASRRLYVQLAPGFEEPWLDEGLSQVAEELLFYRAGARGSRENLNAYLVTLTGQTLDAFNSIQRTNVLYYREFLSSSPMVSPLSSADSRARRGAAWSLLRYLVDRREWHDYISWTDLVNSRTSGIQNLSNVLGANVRSHMRDWAVSLLIDDLFAGWIEFQQPSWNFRSLFSAMQPQPYPLAITPLTSAGPQTVTLSPASSAHFAFTVPANGAATITWSGGGSTTISPMAQWALVRLR